MQYDRDASGKLTPLPRPSVDTGMGTGAHLRVLQGIDLELRNGLIRPIIDRAAELFHIDYGPVPRIDTALRLPPTTRAQRLS